MYNVYGIDGLQFEGTAPEHHRRLERSLDDSVHIGCNSANRAVQTYQSMMQQTQATERPIPVSRIMSSPVLTVNRYQSLYTAWRLLKEENIRQLVVTSDNDMVIGILGECDVLQHITVQDGEFQANTILPVADVLHREMFTTDSTSDIRRVAGVMTCHHIDALPVIDRNRTAVGIVTRGDILRYFAANPKVSLWI